MDELTFKLASGASGSSSPVGQTQFVGSTGITSWVVPANVRSVCVLIIQGGYTGQDGQTPPAGAGGNGSGGAGGNCRWQNNIPVTPGETLTLVYGQSPSIARGATVLLSPTTALGSGVGGGNGGAGGPQISGQGGGGGGAGGYNGSGGNAQTSTTAATSAAASSGAGAGGAVRQSGGGVGSQGQGADGVAGATPNGSVDPIDSGLYGYGGRGADTSQFGTGGGQSILRIIWGDNRAFPSQRTYNM